MGGGERRTNVAKHELLSLRSSSVALSLLQATVVTAELSSSSYTRAGWPGRCGGRRVRLSATRPSRAKYSAWSWLVPPYRWTFDARATAETSAVAFDAACLRAKCAADPAVGYELQRFVGVMNQRLQSSRIRLLDIYGNLDCLGTAKQPRPATLARPHAAPPVRRPPHPAGHPGHLHARARAHRRGAALVRSPASSPCSMPSGSARHRSRSAATRAGRVCSSTPSATSARSPRAGAAGPGTVLGVRGPFGTGLGRRTAARRRRGYRRRRYRPGAAAPGLLELIAQPRSRTAGWCCSTARGRRPDFLFTDELRTLGGQRGIAVEVTVDHGQHAWRGRVGLVTAPGRHGPVSTRPHHSRWSAAPR